MVGSDEVLPEQRDGGPAGGGHLERVAFALLGFDGLAGPAGPKTGHFLGHLARSVGGGLLKFDIGSHHPEVMEHKDQDRQDHRAREFVEIGGEVGANHRPEREEKPRERPRGQQLVQVVIERLQAADVRHFRSGDRANDPPRRGGHARAENPEDHAANLPT